jgi:alkylation response protein AidB-like acyl-CoA dehydrogenase
VDFTFTESRSSSARRPRLRRGGDPAHVREWDEKQHFPRDVVRKLDLGIMGAIFPEEYGGAGLTYVDYVLAVES